MPDVTSNAAVVATRLRERAAVLATRVRLTPALLGEEVRILLLDGLEREAPLGPDPEINPYSQQDTSHPHLRDLFRAEIIPLGDGVSISFTNSAPYVEYVLEGTAPHAITPVNGQFLVFPMGGEWIFARGVQHPETPANPFVERAVDELLPEITAKVHAAGYSLIVGF
jgi:hypothetical protein